MKYNTKNTSLAGVVLPPPAENLPPVAPDSQPVFPRQPGGTLRAFGAFLAFFQSGATGSASAGSPACDVAPSRIPDLGIRRCILVCFGDLCPPALGPPRRVRTMSSTVHRRRQKRSVALFSANVVEETFCIAGSMSRRMLFHPRSHFFRQSRNGQILTLQKS
jgi:hypothetical protein